MQLAAHATAHVSLRAGGRRAPGDLVALPDGRPAALPPGARRHGERCRQRLGGRGLRHPHRDVTADTGAARDLRAERLPPVPDQRAAVRGARRRLVAGHVPALLGVEHRGPARLRARPRAERDPLRGEPAAGGHVRADGPGGHPRPSGLAVLHALGAGLDPLDAGAARERAEPGGARRRAASRPPERARVLSGQRRASRSGRRRRSTSPRSGGPTGPCRRSPRRSTSARRGSAPPARRRAPTTGRRRRTGGSRGACWTSAAISRTSAARSASTPRRARAPRSPRGTRSTASSRRRSSVSSGTRARCTASHSGPEIFHTSPYSGYTAIGRLGQYNTALWSRYGRWSGLASYEREAQAAAYEVTRAQFEATIGQAHDRANPSTGVDLLAAEQGVALAAVAALRLRPRRRRAATSARRRRTRRCTSSTRTPTARSASRT